METIGRNAGINVTPMIDVLLVLIVIFMLVTPVRLTGLNAKVPQPAPSGDRTPPSDVVVTVRADDSMRLNQEPVALADLPARLAVLQMARVIDLARGAGWERVALMPR